MTKREIACRVSKLTGFSACKVDVDHICSEAKVRPFDIKSLYCICGILILSLKGSWTVHGVNTMVKLESIYCYLKNLSTW